MDTANDPDPAEPARSRFFKRLQDSLAQGRYTRLLLTRPQGPAAAPDLQRLLVRRITLRGEDTLSFVASHSTRDMTQNLPLEAGVQRVRELLGPVFRNAHLHTTAEEVQFTLSKKGKGFVSSSKHADETDEAVEPAPAHDRARHRELELTRPFLQALGVASAQGTLVPAMARKWRQINRFVEIFAGAVAASGLADASSLRVADFGSGKGYLTFAVHDWLQHTRHAQAEVVGVELRPDMVQLGNDTVRQLGLQGLRMELGDVRSWTPRPLDVVIALHACDTATDHAIHLGLKAGARIIMCSPCCHKQIRPQLLSPGPMRPVLQHGVHIEQQAEMLTDSLRALLLEAQGYDTQVFEFVSLEHTRKNKMILAVKRAAPRPAEPVLAQIRELKAFFGVREQCLETLLEGA
jgi:hypothetical protein